MSFDRRVWKTGVLAMAATAIFAVAIFQAEEWTGDLIPGGVTSILPQVVSGSYDNGTTTYTTVITITNMEDSAIHVTGSFYDVSGAPSTMAYVVDGAKADVRNGLLSTVELQGDEVLIIRTPDDAQVAVTNWGRIAADGRAAVFSYFELRDGATNHLHARAGAPASPANLASFVIPRVSNAAEGLDVGFALVNTGASAAEITVTAKDAVGAVIATKVHNMPPLSHTAQFVRQFLELSAEPEGTTYGSVTFRATSPQFAVLPLSVQGGSLSSVPFERF
jgi:hypothetical protein